MKFKTETGSVYEVDRAQKRIRRLSGMTEATKRVGDSWRSYDDTTPIVKGDRVIIVWGAEVALLPESLPGSTPTTMTSRIVSIEEDK